MKKLIFSLLFLVTVLSGFSLENHQEINNTIYTSVACKYDQCHATAKSTGNRCKHCVSNEGDRNCWQHE